MRRTATNPSILPLLALLAAFAFRPVVVFAAVPATALAAPSAHCHKADGSTLTKVQSNNPFRIVAKWTPSDDVLFPGISKGNRFELSESFPKAPFHAFVSVQKAPLVLRI